MNNKELIRRMISFDDEENVDSSSGFVSIVSDVTPQQRVLDDCLNELGDGVIMNPYRNDRIWEVVRKYFSDAKFLTAGVFLVCLDGKWNFADLEDGVYLSDIWFDKTETCGYSRSWRAGGDLRWNGVYRVEKDKKYNFFLTDKGMLLSKEWFQYATPHFVDGFAIVEENGKANYLSLATGKLLFPSWFDSADVFRWGSGIVKKSGKYNVIGTDGKLWSDEWFDGVHSHNEDGVEAPDYIVVENNGKQNIISRKERKIISDEWFDYVHEPFGRYDDIIAEVGRRVGEDEYEVNFIDRWGDLISDEWFEDVVNGFDSEYNNDDYYSYDPNEDKCDEGVPSRYAVVMKDGNEYILTDSGELYEY